MILTEGGQCETCPRSAFLCTADDWPVNFTVYGNVVLRPATKGSSTASSRRRRQLLQTPSVAASAPSKLSSDPVHFATVRLHWLVSVVLLSCTKNVLPGPTWLQQLSIAASALSELSHQLRICSFGVVALLNLST